VDGGTKGDRPARPEVVIIKKIKIIELKKDRIEFIILDIPKHNINYILIFIVFLIFLIINNLKSNIINYLLNL